MIEHATTNSFAENLKVSKVNQEACCVQPYLKNGESDKKNY